MPLIETEITIDASPARVWSVLTDFENYPRWNPFTRSIAGTKREGGRLTVTLGPPDGKTMTFKPRILTFAPDREFS